MCHLYELKELPALNCNLNWLKFFTLIFAVFLTEIHGNPNGYTNGCICLFVPLTDVRMVLVGMVTCTLYPVPTASVSSFMNAISGGTGDCQQSAFQIWRKSVERFKSYSLIKNSRWRRSPSWILFEYYFRWYGRLSAVCVSNFMKIGSTV
jgi:hypothetical protein